MDEWHGAKRHTFQFAGRSAWVVEPQEPLPGNPWSWCLMFPDAFTPRCAALQLVAAGFHHAFKAGVALIHVVGDADNVVPPAENADIVEQRYRELGGTIEVIRKPACGHHPHGLDDPKPVVEFIAPAV